MARADGGKLFAVDLLAQGIIHRSLLLITGFATLIKDNNFISAAALTRMYLDCLLEFYAVFIVKDPHKFALKKLRGQETKGSKDNLGEKMSDSYLSRRLQEESGSKWIEKAYKENSKFIHFSEKHIFAPLTRVEGKEVNLSISDKMIVPKEIEDEAILEMLEITKMLLHYLNSWVYTKNNTPLKNPRL